MSEEFQIHVAALNNASSFLQALGNSNLVTEEQCQQRVNEAVALSGTQYTDEINRAREERDQAIVKLEEIRSILNRNNS